MKKKIFFRLILELIIIRIAKSIYGTLVAHENNSSGPLSHSIYCLGVGMKSEWVIESGKKNYTTTTIHSNWLMMIKIDCVWYDSSSSSSSSSKSRSTSTFGNYIFTNDILKNVKKRIQLGHSKLSRHQCISMCICVCVCVCVKSSILLHSGHWFVLI